MKSYVQQLNVHFNTIKRNWRMSVVEYFLNVFLTAKHLILKIK